MQLYKKYFNIVVGIIVFAILAYLCLLFLFPINLDWKQLALVVVVFSLTLILFAKFFIFKNSTIAWFALVLIQLCAIILLYYNGVIGDNFWPVFLFVPAFSSLIVGVFTKDNMLINIFLFLLTLSTSFFLWTFEIVGLGEALIIIFVVLFGMFILSLIFNKLKRRSYGEV